MTYHFLAYPSSVILLHREQEADQMGKAVVNGPQGQAHAYGNSYHHKGQPCGLPRGGPDRFSEFGHGLWDEPKAGRLFVGKGSTLFGHRKGFILPRGGGYGL